MTPAKPLFKKKARELERQIRAIILAWNPIGAPVPSDEYDCLVHKVASSLLRGVSREQLHELITRELTGHFGLPDCVGDVSTVVTKLACLSLAAIDSDTTQGNGRSYTPGTG